MDHIIRGVLIGTILAATVPSLLNAVKEKEEVKVKVWPVYCVRDAQINEDKTVLVDMPGFPYGMDDEPILVSPETWYELESVPFCQVDDPRMQ